jgi:hypothetical protein
MFKRVASQTPPAATAPAAAAPPTPAANAMPGIAELAQEALKGMSTDVARLVEGLPYGWQRKLPHLRLNRIEPGIVPDLPARFAAVQDRLALVLSEAISAFVLSSEPALKVQ